MNLLIRLRACVAIALLAACPWAGAGASASTAPVRFLLTFDDGPSLWPSAPTQVIQQQLADNPYQRGIKAVFFVQTAHAAHGGDPRGQQLMRDTCAAGHLMGLHSGSARGHVPHPRLAPEELTATLAAGRDTIEQLCPHKLELVRPPDWVYTEATLAAYRAAGLGMLQADISANDGKIYGWTVSLRRRSHIHKLLQQVAAVRAADGLPEVDGALPVVVAFHDTNVYTSQHMTEYLQILLEESTAVGLPVAAQPFYTDLDSLNRAAQARATRGRYVCDGRSLSAPILVRWGLVQGDLLRDCF